MEITVTTRGFEFRVRLKNNGYSVIEANPKTANRDDYRYWAAVDSGGESQGGDGYWQRARFGHLCTILTLGGCPALENAIRAYLMSSPTEEHNETA